MLKKNAIGIGWQVLSLRDQFRELKTDHEDWCLEVHVISLYVPKENISKSELSKKTGLCIPAVAWT